MRQLLLKSGALTMTAIAFAASAMAQATLVMGTGNPEVDIPGVQAAVNAGGKVVLRGHFSFDKPPTIPTPLQAVGIPPATILISKAVAISGEGDTIIERGTIPFYVAAPGAAVTIEKLHFVRPAKSAVVVYAVSGLTIDSCRIEGYTLLPIQFSGIGISASDMAATPTPSQPGHPENITGRIVIANNEIDAGENIVGNVLGITTFSAGVSPDKEVDLYITGNRISNITEPGINLRRIGGRAHVEGNVITTGPSKTAARPEAIRAVHIGSYVIAHNIIRSEWADPDAIGIAVFSPDPEWPMTNAVVVDNQVTMLPPDGVQFGGLSAGIDIRGFAQNILVGNNRVRGRARAAVAVDAFRGGVPGNTAFVLNRFEDFDSSLPGVVVGDGVSDTMILGQKGAISDRGLNTLILPFGSRLGATQ